MDWRVKTPYIAGPIETLSVPWIIFVLIGLVAGTVFFVSYTFYDRLSSIGITFVTAIMLWGLACARTRRDRNWADILIEKTFCKGKIKAMKLWNKYHWGWMA